MTSNIANIDNSNIPDKRSLIVKLAEKKNEVALDNAFAPAVSLGAPKKGSKYFKDYMAMDTCIRNVLSQINASNQFVGFPAFVGYALLSSVSQEALIRAGVEAVADDMTRKPVELFYDEDGNEDGEKLINDLNADLLKFKVKEVMNKAKLKDGFFGGCLVYIDVGNLSDEQKMKPLLLDKRTFKAGSLRGFKIIEPVNICAGDYNTTDPMDEHFFNPEWWYILGKRYHASRFLYIAGNDVDMLLKPAYNFFGISEAQLALDYVAHFVANRESAQELLNKFSLTCIGTNLSQALTQDGSWSDIVARIKAFNKFKTNNGTFVFDKETEELMQLNTPLSGVKDIVEMSLTLLTAIWRIPKLVYIGEGEGGLNASSQEQLRTYYSYIHSLQEKIFTKPYDTIIKLLQLNRGLEPDEKLMFKFPSLWDMDEKERADLNKVLADRDIAYINSGVLSQEEARRRLSLDRYSGYSDIDVDDLPTPPEQPLQDGGDEKDDKKTAQDMAMDGYLTEDGRWITIGARKKGENGEDDEGRKGRHIYLEDGETPEEAIEDLKDNDKENKKDTEKKDDADKQPDSEKKPEPEKKPESEEKQEEKQEEKEDVNKEKKPTSKEEYGKMHEKIRKLDYEKRRILDGKEVYVNSGLEELSEQKRIAQNRYYQNYGGNTEENKKALEELEDAYNKKYKELEAEYLRKNNMGSLNQELTELEAKRHQTFIDMKDSYRKKISNLSDSELDDRRGTLTSQIRRIDNDYDEILSSNEEYKQAMMRKSDLMDARWAIIRKDNLTDEDRQKLEKVKKELTDVERKCEYIIAEHEGKYNTDKVELEAEKIAIDDEKAKRYQEKQQKRKEEYEKAKKEQGERGKMIAKDNYYPKTIAGVQRGKEMSESEADSGNPNPNYGNGWGYGINCQSCVVCYEARLRGYDVMTKPNTKGSKLSELSHDTNMAWIDPETGLKPEPIYARAKNASQCLKFLEENVKKGERYNFSFGWKRSREGHIVSMSRNSENKVEIYDPQTNKRASGQELLEYLKRISYGDRAKVDIYGNITGGINLVSKTELLRVDNLAFNPDFMNDIMESRK